jgi:hypothetical protein
MSKNKNKRGKHTKTNNKTHTRLFLVVVVGGRRLGR